MKKTIFSLLLALTLTSSVHAQMLVYLQSFENSTAVPDGQDLSTSNGDMKGAISTTGGTGGSQADTISFDNSQYSVYGGTIGGYDSDGRNRVNTATATGVSGYIISFDVKATNLAANSDFTFTPQVSVIDNFNGGGAATLTGNQLTLANGAVQANGFVHFSLNASTFAASGGNFAANITDPNYDQTIFDLQFGSSETPAGDVGTGAFNAGTSTIFIDNLAIMQVPEPKPALLLATGLVLMCGVRVFRSRRAV